ncbi:carbohydrate kinase [Cristinia sonorae]|uniref:gluconokinase n=1 Tax=Cristinia sonorae TaxID=1940300 RepID=A0A8K0XUY1_9AGAR|nr:carbohydrate kinase [Cristinia sonorae]
MGDCSASLEPTTSVSEMQSSRDGVNLEERVVSGVDRGHDEGPIIIIVMGVAGTGKTTLAHALDAELGMPYIEGDDMHPQTNIDKMSKGIPLTDEDREPWLHKIRNEALKVAQEQLNLTSPSEEEKEKSKPRRKGVMVTCSSLKRYYRSILRGSIPPTPSTTPFTPSSEHSPAPQTPPIPTYFVYIKEDVPVLRDRIANRKGHFMKATMLDSQLATLESPEGEEGVVVVPLNASTQEQVDIALEGLEKLIGPMRRA